MALALNSSCPWAHQEARALASTRSDQPELIVLGGSQVLSIFFNTSGDSDMQFREETLI